MQIDLFSSFSRQSQTRSEPSRINKFSRSPRTQIQNQRTQSKSLLLSLESTNFSPSPLTQIQNHRDRDTFPAQNLKLAACRFIVLRSIGFGGILNLQLPAGFKSSSSIEDEYFKAYYTALRKRIRSSSSKESSGWHEVKTSKVENKIMLIGKRLRLQGPPRRRTLQSESKVQNYEPATMKYFGYHPALTLDEVKERVPLTRSRKNIGKDQARTHVSLDCTLKYIIERP